MRHKKIIKKMKAFVHQLNYLTTDILRFRKQFMIGSKKKNWLFKLKHFLYSKWWQSVKQPWRSCWLEFWVHVRKAICNLKQETLSWAFLGNWVHRTNMEFSILLMGTYNRRLFPHWHQLAALNKLLFSFPIRLWSLLHSNLAEKKFLFIKTE